MKVLKNTIDFCLPIVYTFGKQKGGEFVAPKKMGRPTDTPKQTQLGIRFDEKTLSILDEFCKKEKISRAEGVRRAVTRLKEK